MSKNNLEQLAAAQQANAEVMMSLMRTAFSSMEKLASLNMAASRDFFNDSVSNTQQLLSVRDPQEAAKINATLAQPNVEKMMEYSRSVYELVGQMQKEIASVMEAQYSAFTRNAAATLEKGAAGAPVGGDVFAAAMKSMMQASTKAFDNMNSMAKQMTDIADANVQAATSATAKAAATGTAKKK